MLVYSISNLIKVKYPAKSGGGGGGGAAIWQNQIHDRSLEITDVQGKFEGIIPNWVVSTGHGLHGADWTHAL